MFDRRSIGVITLSAALCLSTDCAQAFDDAKYPNWKGQWSRVTVLGVGGQPAFDPTKPWGPGQQAPLTAEYQKVLEDSMADQAKGGLGNYPTARCLPGGMPRMMTFGEHEYVVTPETTYILIGGEDHFRRIFTDGRDWPADVEPTYAGYSIGSKSKAAARLKVPALTTQLGYLCTSTISRFSRSGFISTRPIQTFFMTKSL